MSNIKKYITTTDDSTIPIWPIITTGSTINISEYETCTKCKQNIHVSDIKKRYTYLEIERIICNKCYCKQLDKLFELKDIDVNIEETLYKPE